MKLGRGSSLTVETKSLAELLSKIFYWILAVSPSVILVLLRIPCPGETSDVPHKGLVLGPRGMVKIPATMAEVVEATQIPTEVWALLHATHGAKRVLKVGIYLDLLAESGRLDLDESRSHSLHVASAVVESYPARADGILKLVSVQPRVHHATEQIVKDQSKALGSHHAVQGSHEDCLLWVKTRRGTPDVVGIGQDPGNNLDFLGSHPPTGYLVIVAVPGVVVLGALGQEVGHIPFLLEYQVQVASWWRGVISARPLDPHFSKLCESLDQSKLGDIPGNTSQEYFGRVGRIWAS